MPKIPLSLALVCSWVLLAPASALAAAATTPDHGESTALDLPADAPQHLSQGSGGGSLARTFIGLAVVIAVIYGVAFAMKKMKSVGDDAATGSALASVATVPLGTGRSVHLIRAGRELVLVGSAEQGVVPIRTYTEDEAFELGLLDPDEPAGAVRRSGVLDSALEQLRKRTAR
jgi:flagellar protein FliO/FliZ